jgi:putative hydrolase of HD superfamily
MLDPKIIDAIFTAASIQRWNDYPRMVDLVELDKQAHKFIIAYLLAKIEGDVDMRALIDVGIYEFLARVVVTDIRPDVYRNALEKKKEAINRWVISKLEPSLQDIDNGLFLEKFEAYLKDPSIHQKEHFILKAASYLSTRWEFSIVYQTSTFLSDINDVKRAVEEEIEDYYELIGVRKIALGKKLAKFLDISGRLRFQKRWAQTPRIPETSVLGHMLIVAILSYFYSLEVGACDKRTESNFFCALFHDIPEALTRDIISPVKYSVSGLDDLIADYEIQKIFDDILPLIPKNIQAEFSYILGLYDNGKKKNEFMNRIYKNGRAIEIDGDIKNYNDDAFAAIDGAVLKMCDRLAAYIEATLSIAHGVTSKELVSGKEQIMKKIKERPIFNGVNFEAIALMIEKHCSH